MSQHFPTMYLVEYMINLIRLSQEDRLVLVKTARGEIHQNITARIITKFKRGISDAYPKSLTKDEKDFLGFVLNLDGTFVQVDVSFRMGVFIGSNSLYRDGWYHNVHLELQDSVLNIPVAMLLRSLVCLSLLGETGEERRNQVVSRLANQSISLADISPFRFLLDEDYNLRPKEMVEISEVQPSEVW